jgi:hypothetical protein
VDAELADGSIVFHFAHPPAEEPEPDAACPDPPGRADASASPQPELGVAGAVLGDPAPVDEPNPYTAAAASEILQDSSDARPVEAPEQAISSSVGVEAEAASAGGTAVAADESELENDANGVELGVRARSSVEESETVEAGVTGPAVLEDFEEADAVVAASSEGSTSQDFDTDVDTKSSVSSGDEQGAPGFGISIPAAVCVPRRA